MQCPELLQPLGQLGRARRRRPTQRAQRLASVGVEAEVLPIEPRRRSPASRRYGIARSREVERPPRASVTTLTRAGSPASAGIERRRRGADVVALRHPLDGARQRLAREEGLVALHVDDDVEARRTPAAPATSATRSVPGQVNTASVSTARTPDRSTTCADHAASRSLRPARPSDHAPGRAESPG